MTILENTAENHRKGVELKLNISHSLEEAEKLFNALLDTYSNFGLNNISKPIKKESDSLETYIGRISPSYAKERLILKLDKNYVTNIYLEPAKEYNFPEYRVEFHKLSKDFIRAYKLVVSK